MQIQLVFKSYEKILLKKASNLLLFLAQTIEQKSQKKVTSSVHYLPTSVVKSTLLRSPHIDKKSREQIELRTYKMYIELKKIQDQYIFFLLLDLIKLVKIEGVQLKCKFHFSTKI